MLFSVMIGKCTPALSSVVRSLSNAAPVTVVKCHLGVCSLLCVVI